MLMVFVIIAQRLTKDILPFWNYGKNKEKELEKIVSDIKKEEGKRL